jgi:phosphatidylglycerophosphate synthase
MNPAIAFLVLPLYAQRHGGAVREVQTGPALGFVAQLALLTALAGTVGVGGPGWFVGLACGLFTNALLARGLVRSGSARLGPADQVTLARSTLAGGVAAMTADTFSEVAHMAALSALSVLAVVALVLDAVDGWVARRTGTASALGARFDMEADAFLILVLSVYVARSAGVWVLAIGAARYAFVAAGWLLPWLRAPLPPRYWRKVVAATQGVVLTVAAVQVLPAPLTWVALVASLALLAESFGRDVWWLWCHGQVEAGRIVLAGERRLTDCRS